MNEQDESQQKSSVTLMREIKCGAGHIAVRAVSDNVMVAAGDAIRIFDELVKRYA